MTATELKPCPFCGGEAYIRFQMGTAYITAKHSKKCLMRPDSWLISSKRIDKQIKAWNMRGEE